MLLDLIYRRAEYRDLVAIVSLLAMDKFGSRRDQVSDPLDEQYTKAFHEIDSDPRQYLMVVELEKNIIGTCHITIIPSLTFVGTTRMQIEAVRVHPNYRGQKIGEKMIKEAIRYGQSKEAEIIQLTPNKQRPDAVRFYEKLGFKATHEGMKIYLKQNSESWEK